MIKGSSEIQLKIATIFDLNGTLVDDAKYQRDAWRLLSAAKGRFVSDEEFRLHIAGHVEADVLRYLFGIDLQEEKAKKYLEEKRRIYRETLGPVMKEVRGLSRFLDELTKHDIPIVLASSASKPTIDFILDTLNLRQFFSKIIRGIEVQHPKPAPDIFIRASEIAGVDVDHCVVFEDSVAGLQSAKSAKTKPIGVTTSLSIQELIKAGAELVISDYTEVNIDILLGLLRMPT